METTEQSPVEKDGYLVEFLKFRVWLPCWWGQTEIESSDFEHERSLKRYWQYVFLSPPLPLTLAAATAACNDATKMFRRAKYRVVPYNTTRWGIDDKV